MADSHLPGKLGDPSAELITDRRLDPRIAQALQLAGELAPGVEAVGGNADYQACLAYCHDFELAAAQAHDLQWSAMPAYEDIECSTIAIQGVDDNVLYLYIHRPANQTGELPCIVHTHGGGMVVMTAADPNFVRFRNDLARQNMVVVGVEFRNGGGELGPHPFPAGLHDCASAVQYVHAHRDELQVSTVTISGESGGGNLAIATTLKANAEGWVDQIDGVYAMCPYISGAYAQRPVELVSLLENDGYMLDCQMMSTMVKVYDPQAQHARNPLAWPYHATPAELMGLPPHVISVNELDPLRDEGLEYYRKLLAAGVPAVARTTHGTPHAGDQAFPDVVPDIYAELVRSIAHFAHTREAH